ncbi:amidase family protein [Nocardia brevicatena]|uniref:amidase family protein n=1 Tax=Nocardia brevicatena TaxID=37327 RepID=UPI0012FB6A99|nr:amidase family protein [Nocardia brevicatena]
MAWCDISPVGIRWAGTSWFDKIEDDICTKGDPTPAGPRIFSTSVPDGDATVIARLRSAGAIIFGRTNLSDFAFRLVDSCPFGDELDHGGPFARSAEDYARILPVLVGGDPATSIPHPEFNCPDVLRRPVAGLRIGILRQL